MGSEDRPLPHADEEVERAEVQRIMCPHRTQEGLQGATQDGRRQLDGADARDRVPGILAMAGTEPATVEPRPQLMLDQPAGGE